MKGVFVNALAGFLGSVVAHATVSWPAAPVVPSPPPEMTDAVSAGDMRDGSSPVRNR
jgi:hypothetical protein